MEPLTTPLPNQTQSSILLRHTKRWIKIIIGGTVLLFGITLIFLPGPAIIVIPIGLAILATELVWAKHLLHKVKEKMPFQKNEEEETKVLK